jgi:hypothetical protein
MAIRILNVHFERPGVVPRRATDLGPRGLVFFVDRRNVLDTDPSPGARAALGSAAKIDPGPIPIHGREVVGTPVDVPKAEHIDIVTDASPHIRNAQDWRRALESGLENRA